MNVLPSLKSLQLNHLWSLCNRECVKPFTVLRHVRCMHTFRVDMNTSFKGTIIIFLNDTLNPCLLLACIRFFWYYTLHSFYCTLFICFPNSPFLAGSEWILFCKTAFITIFVELDEDKNADNEMLIAFLIPIPPAGCGIIIRENYEVLFRKIFFRYGIIIYQNIVRLA